MSLSISASCLLRTSAAGVQLRSAAISMGELGWGSLQIRPYSNWQALTRDSAARQPELLILEPTVVGGACTDLQAIGRFLEICPSVPVIVYASGSEISPRGWMALWSSGVEEVIDAEEDTSAFTIACRLRGFAGVMDGRRVITRLQDAMPHWCLRLLLRALPIARRGPNDGKMTSSLLASLCWKGAAPHHLNYRLRRDGLPSAGWLVRWLVCLRAVGLRSHRPNWEAVALELGFGRVEELRVYVHRLCGRAPTKVTEEWLLALFQSTCKSNNKGWNFSSTLHGEKSRSSAG